MSEVTLREWLEELDLEDYEEKFIQKGVKKVSRGKFIAEKHLLELGMLELEIARCLSREEELKKKEDSHKKSEKEKVSVHMPSSAFGKSFTVSTESLKKEYGELYYVTPMNAKHEENNKFILPMCAASKWRFSSKKDTLKWARKERENRLNSFITFCDTEIVESESSRFYKEQNINFLFESAKESFADIVKVANENKSIPKIKVDRYERFKKRVEMIEKTSREAMETVT